MTMTAAALAAAINLSLCLKCEKEKKS